jgi:hypothetical protein
MDKLILKIKNYNEDVTFLKLNISSSLSEEKIISVALDIKKLVDNITTPTPSTPNIIRFENDNGVYNYELKQIISYK